MNTLPTQRSEQMSQFGDGNCAVSLAVEVRQALDELLHARVASTLGHGLEDGDELLEGYASI